MRFKAYTGITWSVLELTGLLEDEDSRVYYEKFKKHLGLHPFHLTNLNSALNEILSSNLNLYDAELKGFLLAYKNPKLLTPLGETFYDTCFIHVDIEADFYIFRPEVGCALKGIINKKGLDHIGVLVHKAFNVSIPKPDYEEDWVGDNLEMGQEVRFTITHLDITTKLPFIRGALNLDTYLQGCKLIEGKLNKRISINNKNQDDTEKSVNKASKTNGKQNKQQKFFATDSEHSSDEDAVQIKTEILEEKKPKKRSKREVPIDRDAQENEEKKRTKKSRESKESTIKVAKMEMLEERDMNNVSANSEFETDREQEEAKKRLKKKSSNIKLERSSINSDIELEVTPESKAKSKKKSNKSFDRESVDRFSNIKLEQSCINSDLDQTAEEIVVEVKAKSKKKSNKSFDSEFIDRISNIKSEQSTNSDLEQIVEETTAENKIKSKKKAVKRRHLDEAVVNVKVEKVDEPYTDEMNDTEESPSKKKHKKHKHSVSLEIPEDEANNSVTEQVSVKKRSKKSSISDSDFTIPSIKIKRERLTSGSENTQDEDHGETSELPSQSPGSNYHLNEDGEGKVKKKRKRNSKEVLLDKSMIKSELEFEFEDIIIKAEKPDNDYGDNAVGNMNQESNANNATEIISPKKKRKSRLHNDVDDEEMDTKDIVMSPKKAKGTDVQTHSVKIKKEKMAANSVSDEDAADVEAQRMENQKHSKSSPNKHSNKSRNSESMLDLSSVKIKTEMFTNS